VAEALNEALDRLQFAMMIWISIDILFIDFVNEYNYKYIFVIAMMIALFVTIKSFVLLAFALFFLFPVVYAYWCAARVFKEFSKAFEREWYRWAHLFSLFGVVFFAVVPIVLAAWILSQPLDRLPLEPPWGSPVSYLGGVVTATVFAKAFMDLARDLSTPHFRYFAAAISASALLSFQAMPSFTARLAALVLLFVAIRETRKKLTRRGDKGESQPTLLTRHSLA